MGPKMILLLGFMDLVDRITSSLWVQPVVLLKASEPFGRAPPVFSYTPLSQRKLQVVCSRERLHVTVFVKKMQAFLSSELQIAPIFSILTASPSILVWSDSWFCWIAWNFCHAIFILHRIHCSEETACLPFFWGFFLLESVHFLLLSSIHSRHQRDRCTR